MLHLQQTSTNSLCVVCDDVLTIDNPYYLWRFVHNQTQVEYLIFLTNSKAQNPRFDLFSLTLPTDLDLTTGHYSWWIYEKATNTDTDYDGLNVLSNGGAKVLTTFEADNDYESTETDTVYKAQA